jgi:hypothetical protein
MLYLLQHLPIMDLAGDIYFIATNLLFHSVPAFVFLREQQMVFLQIRFQMPFLSDGGLQEWFGLEVGMPFSDGWFEGEMKYTGRHEELQDELTFHAEYGHKSVEEIMIKLSLDITQGLGSRNNVPSFDTRRTILVEDFGAVTIGVIIQASEKNICRR